MSVAAPLRSASPLNAQTKTEELVVHTIRIASNPNVFDPAFSTLTNRVVDGVIGIGQGIWEANGIMVDSPRKWKVRRGLQERACRHFDTLLYQIGICKRMFHLRRGKYENWVRMTTEARDLVRAWRDSDRKRYEPKYGD